MKKLYDGCFIHLKHVGFLDHHNKVLCLDWLFHWHICIATTGMTHIEMAAICNDTSTYLKDTFMLQFLLLMHVWTSNINIYKTYWRGLGDYICSHKFLKCTLQNRSNYTVTQKCANERICYHAPGDFTAFTRRFSTNWFIATHISLKNIHFCMTQLHTRVKKWDRITVHLVSQTRDSS
jgi:hypothetical protein